MRPLPELTPMNEWFWTSGADGQLRIQGCSDCKALVHPPTPVCPACRSRSFAPTVVSGRGTVVAFTVNRHQWLPSFAPPYAIAVVALAEDGWVDNPIAEQAAAMYLASLRQSRIDTLVLGCTHYPLLARTIGASLGPEVQLVDSATETAREVKALLTERGLAASGGPGSTSFFVTDGPDRFIRIGSRFLGSAVDSAVRIER